MSDRLYLEAQQAEKAKENRKFDAEDAKVQAEFDAANEAQQQALDDLNKADAGSIGERASTALDAIKTVGKEAVGVVTDAATIRKNRKESAAFDAETVGVGSEPVNFDAILAGPASARARQEAAIRPKARPQDIVPVPDGGGITTVSTKAINDAAKSTGLGVDAWLSIAKGGAAVAASKNPTLLGALGEGAGVAASSLIAQRASDKAASLKQGQIDATLQAARIRAAAAGKSKLAALLDHAFLQTISKRARAKRIRLLKSQEGKGSSSC